MFITANKGVVTQHPLLVDGNMRPVLFGTTCTDSTTVLNTVGANTTNEVGLTSPIRYAHYPEQF